MRWEMVNYRLRMSWPVDLMTSLMLLSLANWIVLTISSSVVTLTA